jgi:hypothetical protein
MCAEMHWCPDVKIPLLLSDFNENWNASTYLQKLPNIKCYENPFSCSQVVPCIPMDRKHDLNRHVKFVNACITLYNI